MRSQRGAQLHLISNIAWSSCFRLSYESFVKPAWWTEAACQPWEAACCSSTHHNSLERASALLCGLLISTTLDEWLVCLYQLNGTAWDGEGSCRLEDSQKIRFTCQIVIYAMLNSLHRV